MKCIVGAGYVLVTGVEGCAAGRDLSVDSASDCLYLA